MVWFGCDDGDEGTTRAGKVEEEQEAVGERGGDEEDTSNRTREEERMRAEEQRRTRSLAHLFVALAPAAAARGPCSSILTRLCMREHTLSLSRALTLSYHHVWPLLDR